MKNKNKSISVIIIMLICGAIMLCFNRLTPLLVDDFAYCYSYADGSRITPIRQIIPSMLAHYNSMNGRLIAHGMVQLMLMLPGWIFDLINTLVFCLLCWTVYDYVWKLHNEKHNILVLASVFGAFWVFVPAFGEVFLWLDGACNYLWCTTVLLLFIRPVLTDWPARKNPLFWVLYVLIGFVVGGLLETVSFAVMVFFILWALCQRLFMSRKLELWCIYPSFLMLPGYLLE